MPLESSDIISVTIREFCRISGIGRSRIYELLDAGELESVHIGARRLILIDSYRRLIERLRQPAGNTTGWTRSTAPLGDLPSRRSRSPV